jgi:hypothetical protein
LVLNPSGTVHSKDQGAPIKNVGAALRHKTVATTEQFFYARVRSDRAWDALGGPLEQARRSGSNANETRRQDS